MWLFSLLLSLLSLVATAGSGASSSLLIGAFNVQVFGDSKARKSSVMAHLVKILRRYDLVLVQEVRDVDGSAIAQLLEEVNAAGASGGDDDFKLLLGERLGRTNSKEQYAWFYRDSRVRPSETSTTPVPDPSDTWEREPMLVFWDTRSNTDDPSSSSSAAHILATLGIHVDPDDAVVEIDALAAPVEKALSGGRAGLGVLVMGDLNADCSYVTKTEWRCIRENTCDKTRMRLWDPDKFVWLLNDTVDTTTSNSDCAYDRFVYAPPAPCDDAMCSKRISGVGVYDFQTAFALSQEDAKAVSDHFPIELRLSLNSNHDDSGSGSVEKTSEGQRRWTFLYAIAAVVIATALLEWRGRDLCVIQLEGDLH